MEPKYLDFELSINATDSPGQYAVRVVHSPVGETSDTMVLSVEETALRNRLERITKAWGNSRQVGRMIKFRQGDPEPVMQIAKELGQLLFTKLLTSELRSCYRSSLHLARDKGKGLRIRLRIEAPDLAAIPWEFLYDDTEGDYLGLSQHTPIIRYLEVLRAPKSLTVEPPLRILGMVATPSDLPQLNVEREREHMEQSIQHLVEKGDVALTWLEGQTWRDLQAAMREGPWHIFHFIGHGGFNADKGEGTLALTHEETGTTDYLSATNLARLLEGHPSIRLVVLNACEGARASTSDLFSSTGAVLIRRGIPAVISMQSEITDLAAQEFSRTFYDVLVKKISIDAAVTEARKSISLKIADTIEWATPVLHMHTPDGLLFEIDAAAAIFRDAPVARKAPIEDKEPPTGEAPPTPPNARSELQALPILAKKVRQFWVDGVLQRSLQHSALIDIGWDAMVHMVDSPFGPIPIAPGQSLAGMFDEVGRSLLILGVPGSGKTTMLLTLAKDLLVWQEETPEQAIPVVVNLSSWTDSGQTIFDWLVGELSAKYLVPRKIGRIWLRENRLLLLLDGLDEVGAYAREDCVKALNMFTEEQSLQGLAVCCRFKEYAELNARLTMNGAIRLRSIPEAQIMEMLNKAGPSLSGLRTLLERDRSLLLMAETPFMLSMMMRTYRHMPAGDLSSDQFETIERRRRQLMEAYVHRQFRMMESSNTHG